MNQSTDQDKPDQVVRCTSCRRPLTAHVSIARQQGPVCHRYTVRVEAAA
ncbi:hypothetical protein IEE94_11410 [Yimella sp. cx-573]|nr:hypothetical protein [Yimella sp. cx-573]